MVAALGFRELGQVGVEFLLVEEGGRIEPLQLLPSGVSLPIRPGDREQLERLADVTGARDVLAATEIDEFALPVERQVRLVGESRLDVFDLELLTQLLDELSASSRETSSRSNFSSAAMIFCISASIFGKSSSEIGFGSAKS